MQPAYISLGAYGDLLNALPIFYADWKQTQQKTVVVVSDTYADLFDGISYVQPLIYHGHYSQPVQAKRWALTQGYQGQIIQAYGFDCGRLTSSFSTEAWRLAGKLGEFGKSPIVFDRDLERGRLQSGIGLPPHKPIVLVNATGKSSPFAHGVELVDLLKRELTGYRVIDIGDIRCHRIYDLLALYDSAKWLVTTDTATLHLADASDVPVIALIADNPTPWHGSARQNNHALRIRYQEWDRRKGEILEMIKI